MPQQPEQGTCRTAVDNGDGYFTGFQFAPDELSRVRELVESHWRDVLRAKAPAVAGEVDALGIDQYHTISDRLDHGSLWGKKTRILGKEQCAEIERMSLFDYLRDEFGDFEVTDDEGSGYGEIYWRLVRPDAEKDVGPMHADNWFWKLGHGKIPPEGKRRVKVWAALWVEAGRAGLRVVAGSQTKEWPFYGEMRHGFMKPQTDINFDELNPQIVPTDPGTVIIFSDYLLHGGAKTAGQHTRVNLEFSIMLL